MRFHVPQFIEIEDKIFGPLSFRQFVYITGSAGFAYLVYRILPSLFAYPLIAGSIGLGLMLAFYKVNNRPFVHTLEAGFVYFFSSKLYIWKRGLKDVPAASAPVKSADPSIIPKTGQNKLSNMAWDLDVRNTGAGGAGE